MARDPLKGKTPIVFDVAGHRIVASYKRHVIAASPNLDELVSAVRDYYRDLPAGERRRVTLVVEPTVIDKLGAASEKPVLDTIERVLV